MVLDHEKDHLSRWVAGIRIATNIGSAGQTLHEWVKKVEVHSGMRAGMPSDVVDQIKALKCENRELRQASEIRRKASAYFAMAELGLSGISCVGGRMNITPPWP
jgi:transposase-like protein